MNKPSAAIRCHQAAGALLALFLAASLHAGDLPVSGLPVAELQVFDNEMQDFMQEEGLSAGILAVSRNGTIIYQRGFGWLVNGVTPLPEITPMRLASVEKPITAAAARKLIASGQLALSDKAFNLGQPGGGILNIQPYAGLGDSRLVDVTVEDLLTHTGGWDRAVFGDPVFDAVDIAAALGVPSPPGRENIVRYMLSQPLQYTPGTPECDSNGQPPGCYDGDHYSNFGYMVLGLIVEEVSGQSLLTYVRNNVLTPEMWVPSTEIYRGTTLFGNQSSREPVYVGSGLATNVYDPNGPPVQNPYGGWDHDAFVGFGNLVASAAPILVYLYHFHVWYPDIGEPYGGTSCAGHTGGLDGTSTVADQGCDGIHIAILFNDSCNCPGDDYSWAMRGRIRNIINAGGLTWPTAAVDGFWVQFGAGVSGTGGYDDPFDGLAAALSATTDGSKLRLKPGNSNWTGTISQRVRLDAPLGTARIGT